MEGDDVRQCWLVMVLLVPLIAGGAQAQDTQPPVAQIGVRPLYLVDQLADGPLKTELQRCEGRTFRATPFSIGHRGVPLQFPEHTRESYIAAARQGAGVIECDVAFTKDRELVCRHAQCDLHRTTDILARPELASKCTKGFTPADPATGAEASAQCCTSDLTLAEFKSLTGKMDGENDEATTVEAYMDGTSAWRTDLYAGTGTLLSHKESIALIRSLGRKFTPELKAPEVAMPFEGDYTQETYANQMLADYAEAGIPPEDVYPQSFRIEDVRYWIEQHPAFGRQAVYLDDRDETQPGFAIGDPASWRPSMAELRADGINILAPPLWMLVEPGTDGTIVPSAYAREAKAAGLGLIPWSLERSPPLSQGGGDWYYQTVEDVATRDGDILTLLDVLGRDIGVIGVFSDWPATTTFYANCVGLD